MSSCDGKQVGYLCRGAIEARPAHEIEEAYAHVMPSDVMLATVIVALAEVIYSCGIVLSTQKNRGE